MHPVFANIVDLITQIQISGSSMTIKSDILTITIDKSETIIRVTVDHGTDFLRIEYNTVATTITLTRQGHSSTMYPNTIGGFASIYYSCIIHWLEVCVYESTSIIKN